MNKYNKGLNIVVATKDRPLHLNKMLNSLANSSVLPNQIIVVYNGLNIESQVKVYEQKLNLKVVYSSFANQVSQKKLGLKFLSHQCEWVLFLDDDVIVERDAIEILFNKYVNNFKYRDYVGFGLAIKNRNFRPINIWVKLFLYFTKLYSFTPGTLTKGGHPQSYLSLKESSRVQWLNGISLWSRTEINKYKQIENLARYSAYEDVMFSYKVGQTKKLLFACDSYVQDQMHENDLPLTDIQFISGTYARYQFVKSNCNFSVFWLLVGQLVRNIDYIFWHKKHGTVISRLILAMRIYFKLLNIVFCGKNPISLFDLGLK